MYLKPMPLRHVEINCIGFIKFGKIIHQMLSFIRYQFLLVILFIKIIVDEMLVLTCFINPLMLQGLDASCGKLN
jgi:hypothetical protein